MKGILRKIIVWKIGFLAKLIVDKYQPRVVAVTGSVGKTTTKELIAAMLAGQFKLRAATGSYNSEFGVPLTIIDQPVPKSVIGWLHVMWRAVRLLVQRHEYPEVLVLEMGADHPGDIQHLTKIAPPDIAVVTNVGTAHLENYPSQEAIAEEKSYLIRNLKPDGVAILNFDDVQVRMMQAYAVGRAIYYGKNDEANVWPSDLTFTAHGLHANVHVRSTDSASKTAWRLTTPLLGMNQLYAVLAAFAVAYSVGVKPEAALAAAKDFTAPPGRLQLLTGQHRMTILDDTYNASPPAMIGSLEVLQRFPAPRRAILGDMKELGSGSGPGHRLVGTMVAPWLDQLIVVGDEAAQIAYAAREAGMDEQHIHLVSDAVQAAELLRDDHQGGTLLVKGSQAMYLERAVAKLLADPRDEKRLVQRLHDASHQRNLAANQARRAS